MPAPPYHIVFSSLVESRNPAEVYQNLAEIFSIDQTTVEQIFAGRGAIVKSDLDREAAEQYVRIILAAGAICEIEPMPAHRPAPSSDHDAAVDSGHEPAGMAGPVKMEQKTEIPDSSTVPPSAQPSSHLSPAPNAVRDADVPAGLMRPPTLAALLILAGAAIPVASGTDVYWPWQLASESQPPGLLWWVMLPFAAAGILALLRAPAFSLLVCCLGTVVLTMLTVILWEACLIVPLQILPLDRPAAISFILPLLGAAVSTAGCRAMEDLGELLILRLLTACGSLTLLMCACSTLIAADGIWLRWPILLLVLLAMLYSALTIVCACLPTIPEYLLYQARLLFLFLMCWAPVAVFLAHLPLPAEESASALLLGTFKIALLIYGCLVAVAGGLRNEFLYRFGKQV